MVNVLYNNVELTSGIGVISSIERAFTPLKNPETFGNSDNFVINGLITGCLTFSQFIDNQATLRDRLLVDYQNFTISENSNTVFSSPRVVIRNVDFPTNRYVGTVPFSINVESFPENYWKNYYGVTSPSNSYEYRENQNGTVELIRTISARGFNTVSAGNNALVNAKNFCNARTGTNDTIMPLMISGLTGVTPCLKTISESPNRFDGVYSISLTYVLDQAEKQTNILRFSTDVESGINEGLFTVNLNGEVVGCLGTNITGIRNRYNSFNTYSIANEAYSGITTLSDLNTGALSSGVSEQVQIPKLSFQITFTNDKTADTWFDYNTSLNTDLLTDISEYSFEADFHAKGNIRSRFSKVSGLYNTTNIHLLMGSGYSGYTLGIDWNPNPISSGIVFNRLMGAINVNSRFNNEPVPPEGLSLWDYNIEIIPSLNLYNASPLVENANDGEHGYYITNLNYLTRAKLSINGNAIITEGTGFNDGIDIIKTQINTLKNIYLTGTVPHLESVNISSGSSAQSRAVSFNVAYSSEESGFALTV